MEDFNVIYKATPVDSDTTAVTAVLTAEEMQEKEQQIISSALENYNMDKPQIYSVKTNESSSSDTLTLDKIDTLAQGLNSSLTNIETVNQLILKYVLEDGLMGYAYNCVTANVPTDYTLTYRPLEQNGDNEDVLEQVRFLIESFNEDVDIGNVIREVVARDFLEGNCSTILKTNGNSSVIDIYPLSIAYPSGYSINGHDIVEFSVKTLKTKLTKTYKKTKDRKAIYFDNIEKEVQANYPAEVYKAYKSGNEYARLNPDYSECVKINDNGRLLGVSPFFRCLRPLIVLNNIEAADVSDSKARSKKIILQILRKELLGAMGTNKALAEQAFAHQSLTNALKTNMCAYTAPAFVEKVEFVTSKSNNEDSAKQFAQYTTRYLQALGISFVDTDVSTYAVANISITQLLRTVNQILTRVERMFNKYYRTIIKEQGIDEVYAPKLHIARAETMEMGMKMELSKYIYGTLCGSLETSYKMVGLDLDDEVNKRKAERDQGIEEMMTPHATAYTKSADGDTQQGRTPDPNSQDPDKQQRDKDNEALNK